MPERRWTVVVVPHGCGTSKTVEVSQRLLKVAAGAVAVFLVAALALGYSTLAHSFRLSHSSRLERENALLAEEVDQLRGRLASLTDTLDRISERDARIRLLANLEPIDPAVRQAGIGGPSGDRHGSPLAGAGALGQRAEQVRMDLNALIRRANLLAHSFHQAAESLASHQARLAALPSIMPTRGWLSSAFSRMRYHPVLHVARPHEGIDVTAPMGAPIEAPAAGVVSFAGRQPGYGNTIEIDHGHGIRTRYAHASKLLVRKGERVERGERIALVGNSGLATGPHLHYEVHVNGRPVDPLNYVLPDAIVD
ncbi:MAG TPA: peptidoglycan DD-metalloendopeptidase family protein [Gemmatimonadales bacterium]|nr:peptidoglycan DD-metalloendopeptidase family protein [Gemmatimonadales bacterium]